ncbi:MAG: hypothetical protein EOO44_12840 [Flavobacterium sp.]|nr:MAG: hypothetical protein EOO44_12840 [Flavobacterium sp.]
MKKHTYFFLFLFSGLMISLFTACSGTDESQENNSSNGFKIMNFTSVKSMDDKIDEIIASKEKMELEASANFIENTKTLTDDKNKISGNEKLIVELKKYHTNVLKNIYTLRKQVGFTSIKSIADEINSLKLINPTKANELKVKYQILLKEHQNLTTTIFDDRSANVINLSGEVIVNGKKITEQSIKNNSAKYIRDESIISGVAATSGDVTIYYSAGREVHENDLGVKFFRYYTQLTSLAKITVGIFPTIVPIPVTYQVNSGSIAGFVQTGSLPFSEYAFSYDYISGFGPSVRNTGGKKNTPYKPAGGNLSATFILPNNNTVSCNLKYTEQ